MLLDSQPKQPLFEFSGACACCGEMPYVKLLTPICGDRLLIADLCGLLVDLRQQSADLPVIYAGGNLGAFNVMGNLPLDAFPTFREKWEMI